MTNFLAIRNLYKCNNGQDLILFNNKDILINGKRFFLPKWKEKGVVLIQDVLDSDGKPLTFSAFQNKFNVNLTF